MQFTTATFCPFVSLSSFFVYKANPIQPNNALSKGLRKEIEIAKES